MRILPYCVGRRDIESRCVRAMPSMLISYRAPSAIVCPSPSAHQERTFVYRGLRYQHDTERDVPDEVARQMLAEGTARPVPLRATDRADATALAQAFRQMHQ